MLSNKKKNASWWIGLFFTAFVLGGYCLTIGFRGMAPAEGWYTWYAELINNERMVYRDFSYLFFPCYIQLIALFVSVFGESIFALRVFGLLIFMAIGVVAYLIFGRLTNPVGATIAAITTTMYLQSEVVQIFYDYIRVMDLFAFLTIYFLVRFAQSIPNVDQSSHKHINFDAIFAGVFATLTCMTKQSTGTLLIVYIFILLTFLAIVLKKKYRKFVLSALSQYGCAVLVLFVIMAIWLISNEAGTAFLINATGNAIAAKGGMFTVLFRWLIVSQQSMISQIIPSLKFMAFLALIVLISRTKFSFGTDEGVLVCTASARTDTKYERPDAGVRQYSLLTLFAAFAIGLTILAARKFVPVAIHFSDRYPVNQSVMGFVLCTLCFAFIGFYLIYCAIAYQKKETESKYIHCLLPWFGLLGAIFAIAYGVGISGGLCESQTALTIGFMLALAAKALERFQFRIVAMCLLILYSAFFSASCASRKYCNLYSWWGLTSGSVWEASYESEIPMLSGIKMNAAEQEMYDGVASIIAEHTQENDTIFCFPHIPIFYSLTDRTSNTYTQVQWFDMSNIKDILRDIETLKADPPKAIIYCHVPDWTYAGHENSFNGGEKSQTRVMSEFLLDFANTEGYTLAGEFPICDGYSISVYVH